MTDSSHTQAKLEFHYPAAVLQQSLQRAVDLVSFGLQMATGPLPPSLDIPGAKLQFTPVANHQLYAKDVVVLFQSWVLANGLRDYAEALGPTLEWARRHCVLWSQPGTVRRLANGGLRLGARFTGAVWNSEIVAAAAKFDRLPLPNKMEHLEQKYGLQAPELWRSILSVNAVRNCLAHRQGVVGAADLKAPDEDGLTATWRRMHFSVEGSQGQRPLEIPSQLDPGDLVTMETVEVRRTYNRGERISLTPADFVDLAWTFVIFGQQLEGSVRALQERRFAQQGEG